MRVKAAPSCSRQGFAMNSPRNRKAGPVKKTWGTVMGLATVAGLAHGLELTSFTSSGEITWTSEASNGTITIERICDLMDEAGWTELARVTVSGTTGRLTIPICTNEAYYRLTYISPENTGVNTDGVAPPPIPSGLISGSSATNGGLAVAGTFPAPSGIRTTTAGKSTDMMVVIKDPTLDSFLPLEDARKNILQHWRMIYSAPLVFTNQPGSQMDLQDLANALNKLSGYFYHAQ